ncbi:TetR family transcriptional regulator [Epidermidibacterium keratini]|uniref:TetR family transcriptional regulator n=1 Tax=Epidermidibacterium keratini TaxID=1891644 RepID=A0A7L4YP21_9ACTN|nr:TetR/AcrR family transcriptional regulator [Epidermidibacterium keratini]QHC00559.1 TetR family transcriptional regulator [Epidermidibacterium keratini]
MTTTQPIDTNRPLTPAGEAILESASRLFYSRGINAVGVEAIALEAQTTKKTLYDRFGSKDGLVTVYLTRRLRTWQQYVEDYLTNNRRRRKYAALLLLDALGDWLEANERGCGFINAYAELAGTGAAGIDVIREEKQWVRQTYSRLCAEDGLSSPERRGAQLALIHEGAMVALAVGDEPDAIEVARALAQTVLRG